ncbi:hypothetical protein GCM10028796_17210 [Ramlibacter monticola]|uniref:Uncharacterized protein n=1 Tax=Ramlibacter monticola TaxID=1926872 RepID=A0A936YZ32_9BURK|nr:hypothetical protein [Ramlibacter monticola]MBL0390547.1 hypothetical protein [Ramlibacter monticola]
MNLAFAHIPGAFDGAVYMPGVEVTEVAQPAPAPKPAPQVPPPVWDARPISPDACERATHAMCGG